MQSKKTFILLTSLIASVLILLAFAYYLFTQNLINSKIVEKARETDFQFHEVFNHQEEILRSSIESIANDPEIPNALQSKNKALLLKKYHELFNYLKDADSITHFYFHLPDRTNLIRIHSPEFFGDLIDRKSLMVASSTNKVAIGIEQGLSGNLTLRVVKPIIFKAKTIGYLELGTEIPNMMARMKDRNHSEYTILINKNLMEQKEWENRTVKLANQSAWDDFEHYLVIASSKELLDKNEIGQILNKNNSHMEKEITEYDLNQNSFIKTFSLKNLEDQEIGKVLINGSVKEIIKSQAGILITTGGMFFLSVMIIVFGAWNLALKLFNSNLAITRSAELASLGEMTSGLTHEIANLLTVIVFSIEKLKRSLKSQESLNKDNLLETVKRIERMTNRISKLNSGMRLASRNGEQDQMVPTSIKSIILETLDICEEKFKTNNIEFRMPELPEYLINCRSNQISQVIINLLNNAIDAVSVLPEKWIEIKIEPLGEKIIITICDSGTGIPHSIASKMMSPFFTTKGLRKGTGLGLSISQRIISEHHGVLSYDSTKPNTCFKIELPVLVKVQ